ncbi:MAG: hypothetical protein WKG00_34725 [Polyangiaceae bacterium]
MPAGSRIARCAAALTLAACSSSPAPATPSADAPPEASAAAGTTTAEAAGSAAPAGSASPQSGELIGVPITDKPTAPAAAGEAGGAAQSVELVFVESLAKKGAPKTLLFDVTLRNARTDARWFILPAVVHPQEKMVKSGVDGVELWTLSGAGRALVGKFTGKGAFHAVLLPPGAEVKVEKLPIECQYATVKECAVPIEAIVAQKMTIGGEPGDKWLGDKPQSDGSGTFVYQGAARKTGGKKTGSKDVVLEDAKRVKMTLIVGR